VPGSAGLRASAPRLTGLPPAAAIIAPGLPEMPRRSRLPIVLLALLAIGGVGAAGYFFAQSRARSASPAPPIAMAVTTIDAPAAAISPAPAPPAPAAAVDAGIAVAPTPTPTLPTPTPTPSLTPTRPDTRPPAGAAKKDPGRDKDPPRSGPPGFITIDSSPMYSVIFIDGKRYGETPLVQLSLPPGKHSVRAVSPSGASRAMTITIESGKVAPPRRIEW
jgi:hypothetical protein